MTELHDVEDVAAQPVSLQLEHCARVIDLELTQPLPVVSRTGPDGVHAAAVWALLRAHGVPLASVLLDVPAEGLQPADLEPVVSPHRSGIAGAQRVAADRAAFLDRAPRCTVVICTREHPAELARCLESLTRQDHPDVAVVVVDNAPLGPATRDVVASFAGRLDVRYVLEPRPGLSRARNAALAGALDGEIVAWLDDDEVADPSWLGELVRAFDGRPEVLGASGVVVPAELASRAQLWFEQFGGHSKGRGFIPAEFSPRTWSTQHPLFPLPPFGVGANMAFRTAFLRERGGFDEALGAGSPTQGSEDTKMFTDLLRNGGTSLYWPSAVTRHYHRRDVEGLRRQMYGYGAGLTAFYLASVLERPSTALTLLRLAPRALREVLGSSGVRSATIEADFPPDLLAHNRRGMLAGPWLYLRARRQLRSTARREPAGGSPSSGREGR